MFRLNATLFQHVKRFRQVSLISKFIRCQSTSHTCDGEQILNNLTSISLIEFCYFVNFQQLMMHSMKNKKLFNKRPINSLKLKWHRLCTNGIEMWDWINLKMFIPCCFLLWCSGIFSKRNSTKSSSARIWRYLLSWSIRWNRWKSSRCIDCLRSFSTRMR